VYRVMLRHSKVREVMSDGRGTPKASGIVGAGSDANSAGLAGGIQIGECGTLPGMRKELFDLVEENGLS